MAKVIEREIIENPKETKTSLFRYSVDYLNHTYDRNFRAEVIFKERGNWRIIKDVLIHEIERKINLAKGSKGLAKLYKYSSCVGEEGGVEIGENDIEGQRIGVIYVTFDSFQL